MPRLFGKKKTGSKTAESSAPSSTSRKSSSPARESEDTRYNPPAVDALAGLSGKERARKEKELAREMAQEEKRIKADISKRKKSLSAALKESDKLLSDRGRRQRRRRTGAKDVLSAIGFDMIYADGTAQVEEGLYSQTLHFSDISYQAARIEEQKSDFNLYSDVFNYCGPDTSVQISVVNTPIPQSEIGSKRFFDEDALAALDAEERADELRALDAAARAGEDVTEIEHEVRHRLRSADYAREYNKILNDKMREGVSNIRRDRYITFAVAADSYSDALPRLTPIRNTFAQNLSKLGCSVRKLEGVERAELVGGILNCGHGSAVDYGELLATGMTIKDCVCPTAIDKKPDGDNTMMRIGEDCAQVLVFKKFGSQLSDRALSSLIDLPFPLVISLQIQALDKGNSVDQVKTAMGMIDMEMIRRQQKAAQKGYDPTLSVPQDLAYSKNEGEELLDELLYKGQRLFLFTGCVMTYAADAATLQQQSLDIARRAHVENIELDVLPMQQLQGLNTVLPMANNHLHMRRYMTTANVSIMMPFATQEINEAGGGYYGQNKLSGNLIMLNRKKLSTPMGFVLGMPGSGKSFFVKREITNSFMQNPDDEFIIIDPKNEYPPLVSGLGGTVFTLPADCVNLFDVYEGSEEAGATDPVAFKAETMLAVCSQILSTGTNQLAPEAKSIIDRCVRLTFAKFRESRTSPTLGDFYEVLKRQSEPVAAPLVTAFELYVEGGMSYFNRQTTFDIDSRITSFSFKGLSEDMKVFAMLVVLDWVYNRTLYNHERGIRTWLYIDEVQSLFDNAAVVRYFDKFWSEGRAWGLIPTGITQTVGRLVGNEVAQNLLRTSGFLALLRQSDLDKQQLTQILQLSPQQQSDIERSIGDGEGLLIAGNATVGFTDNFPKGDLYNLWNTKPDELADAKREAWERKLGRRAARKAAAQAAAENETTPADGLRAPCGDAAGASVADNGGGPAKAEEKGAAPVASEERPTPAGLDAKEARERAKKLAVPDAVRALITHALTCGTCSGTASELAAMCGAKASGMALARLLNVHEQAISEAGLSVSVDRSSKPHTITLARTR
ncbi:MAG: conjugal transfer protein TraC [Senegalimassilia sp.]|nr:conjugal transfer protein TraC [Senegalimassilia sp.]